MKTREVCAVSGIGLGGIVLLLLLGAGMFRPVFVASAQPAGGIAPGAGDIQLINADGFAAYPGNTVKFATYACSTLPCSRDVQVKVDIPAATFPASVQIYYDALGKGWQNQVFSIAAPQSTVMTSPHNLDLGTVTFSQYGLYVLAFVNADMQSTSWEYFQVQPGG